MAPFERGLEGTQGLVERWRERFEEIVTECKSGWRIGRASKRNFTGEGNLKKEKKEEEEGKRKGKGKDRLGVVRRSQRVRAGSVAVVSGSRLG